MSYTILGRAVKNEYIALGVFGTTFGTAYLVSRGGGAKSAPRPTTIQQAKDSVVVNAASAEEEKFILNFIKEAEKTEGSSGH